MSQTLFYLMPNGKSTQRHEPLLALQQVYDFACELARQAFINQQWVYIHCTDKEQAYAIDELLWQLAPQSFVPHNLKGEGPTGGAPVEIGFDRLGANKNRHVLINLADQVPQFAVNFVQIIDFVANDDSHKAIARDRYRQYRTLGIALTTQDLSNTTN
ncbi:DNA polymerase III chi subunit, HolC [Shewanella piezotolerans WP3]|uniref:DNA polymerase III chi subunit, HolC n=1 Tax=Shewanella piezotolerans (strain WP3 / JCM 13877) TaxID=225849 RepID=B8CK09_SHEPW|nr:DNA polymerase III subunit chi [Shewanella piezotolerans]ACJ27712.1 DNA polymerase III chi subunit, HolC [Shewanella piezotolerans WP3]